MVKNPAQTQIFAAVEPHGAARGSGFQEAFVLSCRSTSPQQTWDYETKY